MTASRYETGAYLEENPTWHREDSVWKTRQILDMMRRHALSVETVCEVGCGAGEICYELYRHLPDTVQLHGYDVSPDAIAMCAHRTRDRLHFHLADLLEETLAEPFDLVLTIDVIEHVEDYIGFVRRLRPRGRLHLFHIPLEMNAQHVLRGRPLRRSRARLGHLHYFSKDSALATLRDAGYAILDHRYTAGTLEAPSRTLSMRMAALPRRLAFRADPDLAARVLGGWSLLVLAQ